MQLPTFQITANLTLFDEGIQRFMRELFPNLVLSSSMYGAARRYLIQYEGQTIAEIEALPIFGTQEGEELEIRVVSLNQHWGKFDGETLTPPTPSFCAAFYQWAQGRYGRELPNVNFAEFFQGVTGDWESIQFDDPTAEAMRQALVADNQRGLPEFAREEPQKPDASEKQVGLSAAQKTFILPLPFDELRDATNRWAAQWVKDWGINNAKLSVSSPQRDTAVFQFAFRSGKLGEITLYRTGEHETRLSISDPAPFSATLPTEEDYKNYLLEDLRLSYLTALVNEGTLDLRWLGDDFIMGFPIGVEIFNDVLKVTPPYLSAILERIFPCEIVSQMNKGSVWHFTIKDDRDWKAIGGFLFDAEWTAEGLKFKSKKTEEETVGRIITRQLTEHTSRVRLLADLNQPEIVGFLCDVTAGLLAEVAGVDAESWRKSARSKLIPNTRQKGSDSRKPPTMSKAENQQPPSATTEELFIDDIDSFAKARNVKPQAVRGSLPLDLSEDQIQTYLEEIIGENFHQQDWGGEINDLMTSQLIVNGKRLRAAFLLKGNGTKGRLTISKCGKNGDQIVRLADAPVDLYVIQHVGEIDERVVYDLKSKIQLKNSKGQKCWMCIMNGTDTARILRAYGKI